jgi:TetR/AcrR family transcriptional repressor of lmrAB and yxaGH operons
VSSLVRQPDPRTGDLPAMANAAIHKDNLEHTAMRLFRTQGYASSGLQQILAESGAPKGSLYHYFPGGKEALAEAAVELAGSLVAEMLTELAARHRSPKAFVSAYCRTLAGWMEESEFRSGCPIATTMLETAPWAPEVTAAGARALDRWIEIIAEVFARDGLGVRAAATRAQLLVAAVEGALIVARVRQSTRPILDVAGLFG